MAASTTGIGGKYWLSGDAAASFLRLFADSGDLAGLIAAGRTYAEQAILYALYKAGKGNLAAKPGTSLHESGLAIDVTRGTPLHTWLTKGGVPLTVKSGESIRAHEYGWYRTVPSEAWHFRYYRAKDRHRSAALAARLAALGYGSLTAFQKAHGLTADGVDGPITWTALLAAIPNDTQPTPDGSVNLRVASYNVQAKRWGGGTYAADSAFVKTTLRPSILMVQEAEEDARDAIREATGFRVWPLGYVGLLWDPTKWDNGPRLGCGFGTAYHGVVGCELTRRTTGRTLVAASVHIRPTAAFKTTAAAKAGKKADIAKVIKLLAKYPRVVVGGDWNTDAKAQMVAAGYTLATPYSDTHDNQGIQHFDGIFTRGLTDRTGGRITPTAASDHHGLIANLTIPTIPTA
jgi:hypothetical protein